ncbi:hypothetical protein BDZ89DRAFT_1078120 [Hymenopellis radicata]|nr:hypothetical protein BDZ89DRAFT_1078120 [Hymenopellis radicata]
MATLITTYYLYSLTEMTPGPRLVLVNTEVVGIWECAVASAGTAVSSSRSVPTRALNESRAARHKARGRHV